VKLARIESEVPDTWGIVDVDAGSNPSKAVSSIGVRESRTGGPNSIS
jgi:hypothetical protein